MRTSPLAAPDPSNTSISAWINAFVRPLRSLARFALMAPLEDLKNGWHPLLKVALWKSGGVCSSRRTQKRSFRATATRFDGVAGRKTVLWKSCESSVEGALYIREIFSCS
jgi:hypothetical protein